MINTRRATRRGLVNKKNKDKAFLKKLLLRNCGIIRGVKSGKGIKTQITEVVIDVFETIKALIGVNADNVVSQAV